jgi:hypothetical protein
MIASCFKSCGCGSQAPAPEHIVVTTHHITHHVTHHHGTYIGSHKISKPEVHGKIPTMVYAFLLGFCGHIIRF